MKRRLIDSKNEPKNCSAKKLKNEIHEEDSASKKIKTYLNILERNRKSNKETCNPTIKKDTKENLLDKSSQSDRMDTYKNILLKNSSLKLKQRSKNMSHNLNVKLKERLHRSSNTNSKENLRLRGVLKNTNNRMDTYKNILLNNNLVKLKQTSNSNLNSIVKVLDRSYKINWTFFSNMAFNYDSKMCYDNIELLKIGDMNVVCKHCNARKFKRESDGLCCANGKVKLEKFHEPPMVLRMLLNKQHKDSSNFLTNIRRYNNAFSFTSFGTTVIVIKGKHNFKLM